MRRSSKAKAFTLVELLIVMAIIGLLSIGAIAGGSYAIRQGRISRKMKNVDQFAAMLQAHYNDSLTYPQIGTTADNTPSLVLVGTNSLMSKLTTYSEGFTFNYEPCTGTGCYAYSRPSTANSGYALCAQLDTTSSIRQANVSAPATNPTKFCYCTGGANSLYVTTCNATTTYK